MAKADLRKADLDYRREVGRVVEHARRSLGWSLKEFADKVGRDERQCARWESGEDRPQFDRILAVKELRTPMLVGFAKAAGEDVEIITEIRVKRSA